eukprot:RCo040295
MTSSDGHCCPVVTSVSESSVACDASSSEAELLSCAAEASVSSNSCPSTQASVKLTKLLSRDFSARLDREPVCLIPRLLYLGSLGASENLERLEQLQVRGVISACVTPSSTGRKRGRVKMLALEIADNPAYDISRHFEEVFDFIEGFRVSEAGAVLLHCFAGRSRSVALAVAYLMRHFQWTFPKAMAFVRERRPLARPNLGFVAALVRLQGELRSSGVDLSGEEPSEEERSLVGQPEPTTALTPSVSHTL